ncbi:FAD-dependent oxidoreductase [Falsiroseomonas sp. CW058]|uniref:FAD-dependent oxidoreductase n=1 Tax=Falsiroseomonas sp. CW058 TaxID=3388664 RepID=UPI003D31BA44
MEQTEVLVAGAGAAGMVAALAAAHRGARVVLLERDAAEPSTFATSGGLFAAPGTRWQRAAGVEDSPALFADDLRAKTGGTVDEGVLAIVATHAARLADFLADGVGIPLHLYQRSAWPGHSAARLHATPGESGAEFNALLRAAVAAHPAISLRDGAALAGLEPNVAEVSEAGARRRIAARGIVLATGGHGGDAALLARVCPPASHAVHVGGKLSDGTAVRLAEPLGAALACMDAYQGQPHVSPHLVDGVRPRLGAALPALGAVMVNRQGRRFATEDMGPSELAGFLLSQPGGRAVEIWDAAAQDAAMAGGPFRRAVELGAVRRFDDVAALAAAFALPAATLAATLAEAAACARGEAADPFGRRAWRAPLSPPFHAAEVTGALAHTQGGLAVDDRARVRRAGGGVLPWLFAAGGAACGISGRGASGYLPGNGLSQSFVLGMVAGEAAAALR